MEIKIKKNIKEYKELSSEHLTLQAHFTKQPASFAVNRFINGKKYTGSETSGKPNAFYTATVFADKKRTAKNTTNWHIILQNEFSEESKRTVLLFRPKSAKLLKYGRST